MNRNIFPGEGLCDPHAIVEDGKTYIFCGKDKSPRTDDDWKIEKWYIISSEDLKSWNIEAEILPQHTHIGNSDNHCWAGDIIKKDNRYYWFYSNGNIDIGVVVADTVQGPYKKIIEGPLIPCDFSNTRSYDPCIYEENGVYTLFYGVNRYFYVELGEDLISVKGEPKRVYVRNEDGTEVVTDDKITIFKRQNIYYMCYGDCYAISKTLTGPYQFMGEFVGGGHNDVFEIDGQYYICNEFFDTSVFFRGIRVMELNFDTDGKVIIAEDDEKEMIPYKKWNFEKKDMHWFTIDGGDCTHENGMVYCYGNAEKTIRTPIFPGILLKRNSVLQFCVGDIKEGNLIIEAEIVKQKEMYWVAPYTTEKYVVKIKKDCQEYEVDISTNGEEWILRKLMLYIEAPDKDIKIGIKEIKCNLKER